MNEVQEWLLDTNCLIDIYLGRSRIQATFDGIIAGDITPYMSVISEAELWRGLRANEFEKHHALIAQFTVIPLGSEAARLAGSWMQKYQGSGLGWMDAMITATARVIDIPVLTRDKKLAHLLGHETAFDLYA